MSALREATLDLLAEWTPIRSAAGDEAGLRSMAFAVKDRLRRIGAEIVPDGMAATPCIVHARFDHGAPTTLLLYNMYDVMPATEAGWRVPPFAGGTADMPQGLAWVGRGAENNKGPLAGMLVAIEAMLPTLRANLEVIVEGEEESGSRALRRYLEDGPVRRCAAALFPSFCEYGGGPPRVFLGSKGIARGRIRFGGDAGGGAWGGPERAVHSSNISWIDNPAWALVHALAGLVPGANGLLGQTTLPPDVVPLLDALAAEFDPLAELRMRRASRFAVPGDARALLEAVLASASLNLAEIRTDPPGGRGSIPPIAEAHFDLRVPPGIDPAQTLDTLRARLPAGADLLLDDCYSGHRFGVDAPGVAALLDAYRTARAEPQVWPWTIGAMPASAFATVADSFLIGGLGHGGNAHGVDEFVTLQGIDRFISSLLAWIPAIAQPASGDRP